MGVNSMFKLLYILAIVGCSNRRLFHVTVELPYQRALGGTRRAIVKPLCHSHRRHSVL